jgi:hypothetical protein
LTGVDCCSGNSNTGNLCGSPILEDIFEGGFLWLDRPHTSCPCRQFYNAFLPYSMNGNRSLSISVWLALVAVVLAATVLVSGASAQTPKALWVVQPPDQIVLYDLATFVPRRTIKAPARVVQYPEYLAIGGIGQMLFRPPRFGEWLDRVPTSPGHSVWFWDGHQATEWQVDGANTKGGSPGKDTVTAAQIDWFLSADGRSLFSLENEFEKVMGKEDGLERSVRSTARAKQTDVASARTQTVATLPSSGWCECGTGTCYESCPEWEVWTPDGVVSDFLLLTQVTPGQIGATYHQSVICERQRNTWQIKKLSQPIFNPLTYSTKGKMLVATEPDGGCCGWENESSDRLLLLRNGKFSVLYDEWDRYDNRNYDVSFYVRDARFAPDHYMLAYTLVSTGRPATEIRLSSEGKENVEELARIRKAITQLPAVEVMLPGVRPRPITMIPHAELVGWLNNREILIAKDGRLVVYDSRGVKRKVTPIPVRTAADGFVR